MKNLKNKELYIQRRTQQLKQWERVLDKLISRVDKTKDQSNMELRHHIAKIQVKKARTAAILRHLQVEGNGNWDDTKASLENSWTDLRKAFLKSSTKPK